MNRLNIGLIGYGKMGKTIEELAVERGHAIVLKIDRSNTDQLNKQNLRKCDVAIDFSRPESALNNILLTLESGTPVISGTTGWLDNYEKTVVKCKEVNGAFLYASNFSIGVNIFFKLNQWLASRMNHFKDYTVEMEEIHHTQKLDAPSGTAITLANDIIKRHQKLTQWKNESSEKTDILPIVSRRIPDVPGTHSITYQSEIDSIKIEHTAHSRNGFALGAILAAEWIIGKTGVFSMDDVLDL